MPARKPLSHPVTNDTRPRNDDDTFTHPTVLSGDLDGNDIARPAPAADQTAYDATRTDNSLRVVRVREADVVLNGLTITAGEGGTTFGIGLLSTVANTTVTACTFTNNTTTDGGSGAYFAGAGATVTDCAFMGNVENRGSGAYFENVGATVTGNTFMNNTAITNDRLAGRGSGVFFQEAGATLTDNVFTGNTATGRGGGVYFDEASGTFTGNTFTGNTAGEEGGGAFLGGTSTLTGNTFMNNTGATQGGGAYFTEVATLTGVNFTDNITTGEGGGAYFLGTGTLTNGTFMNNTAVTNGGGALFSGVATLTGVAFSGNTATNNNGGGANFNDTATLTDVAFSDNTAGVNGGGAFFTEMATLTGGTFSDNTATTGGGGAYFTESGTLTNVAFTANAVDITTSTGTTTGGGAHFNATATLAACAFTGNTAKFGGGAYARGRATVTNSVFYNNTARESGGLRLRASGDILQSTFYSNTATQQGGGLTTAFDGSADPFTLRNSVLLGNTVPTTGATSHHFHAENGSAEKVLIETNLIGGGAAGNLSGSSATGTLDEADATVVFASTMPAEANFLRLAAGSPAIDAGNVDFLNNGTPDNMDDDLKTDAAGAARVRGRGVDLGAYESDTRVPQTLTFMLATSGTVGDKLPLTATSDAGLPVTTFASSDEAVAAIGTGADAGQLVLLTAGMATITASQSGTDFYAAATATQTITVSKLAQTLTFTLAATGTVGTSIALNATSSAGLAVTYASDNEAVATIGLAGTPNAGMLMLLTTGTATITASQPGDASYAAATAVTQSITVERAGNTPQAITFVLPATGTVGATIDLTATADSGLPVTYASDNEAVATIGLVGTPNAGRLVLLTIGTVTITASQPGNPTYAAATPVTQSLTVEPAGDQPQTITFTLPATGTVGTRLDLVATASSGLPVSFTSSASNIAAIGAAGTTNEGKLVLNAEGTVTITASQPGSATYAPAPPVTQTLTVEPAGTTPQTITFVLPVTTAPIDGMVPLAAMSTSGLFVGFEVEISLVPEDGTASLIDNGNGTGTLTLTGGGRVTVIATQPGNSTFAAAPPVTQTLTVSQLTQTLTFTLPATGEEGTTLALTATATSGLPARFSSDNPAVAAIGTDANAGRLVLLTAGSATITAFQDGTSRYAAAPPVTQTLSVSTTGTGNVLGLATPAASLLTLAPNPTTGRLRFSERVAEFRLFTIEGRLLEVQENVRSVDITARPAGLYFVEVVVGGGSVRWRVVRE